MSSEVTMLNRNVHKTYEWLKNIGELAQWDYEDRDKALAILKIVLHELRDNLLINNLAHFSSQLPIVIRGLLFEGWHPDNTPLKERKQNEFLASIYKHLPEIHRDIDIEIATRAVFATIVDKIDILEVEKLKRVLPNSIRDLIP